MTFDPFIPRFPFSVAAVSISSHGKVTLGALNNWLARGTFEIHQPAAGKGNPRLFSFADIIAIIVCAKLSRLGVSVGEIADAVRAAVARHLEQSKTLVGDAQRASAGHSVRPGVHLVLYLDQSKKIAWELVAPSGLVDTTSRRGRDGIALTADLTRIGAAVLTSIADLEDSIGELVKVHR